MIISGAENYSALLRIADESHPNGSFEGELSVPSDAYSIAIFAHGCGSSRFSPRNRLIAQVLRSLGIGTLLLDLSTTDLDSSAEPSLNEIELMAARILAARSRLDSGPYEDYPVGLLGSGSGGAAALISAALEPDSFDSIVLRGARLELAGSALALVRPPTLLIAGSRDIEVVNRYREHMETLGCGSKRFELVPGAGHAFEEPGALASVAIKASNWFEKFMTEQESTPLRRLQRFAYLESAADA